MLKFYILLKYSNFNIINSQEQNLFIVATQKDKKERDGVEKKITLEEIDI